MISRMRINGKLKKAGLAHKIGCFGLWAMKYQNLSIAARCIPPEDRMDVYHFTDFGAPKKWFE